MKKILAAIALGLVLLAKIEAQVLPPDFLCVRGDTLFWNLPSNSCGPFVGYEVWASQTQSGPFTLQGTVTNQAQDFFYFPNPSGVQWYFYLLSNYNCPGQTAIPSDTLDNRPPMISPIETVSVEGGLAVVTWEASPSPEVVGYVIYRETDIGVIPVDTVFGSLTYTDPNSDPTSGPESYFVNALDPCGNTSIFDVRHTSMFVEAEVVPCRQSVMLTWNNYEGWTNGIAEQQIWVGINGGALTLAADAGSSAGSYEVENVMDGATYCFEVRAVAAGNGLVAKSNQICLPVDIVESADGMFLQNVSVTGNDDVQLTWNWNPLAELVEVQILSSEQNADYQTIATQTPTPPLTALSTYTDDAGLAGEGKVFYKIQVKDVCDSVLTTNYGSTIYMTAIPGENNTNQLDWTAFDIENANVESYTVHKLVGSDDMVIGTVGVGTTSFEDSYDPTNLADAQACYYVVAKSLVTLQNGQTISQESRSNTACVSQAARIYVPNAFVPEGINQEFRPLIVLGDIASYELRVFDRYGHEVFMTNVVEQGWDGQKGGKNMPQGVYTYTIKLSQASGSRAEKRGVVLLIR